MTPTSIRSRVDSMDRSEQILLGSWVVITGASLGSLALSEVLGLMPCELCWYQRGLLYPQVFIVGGGLVLHAVWIAALALPLSVAGLGVASYHSWLQLQPNPGDACTVGNPCSEVTFQIAGLSIPNLSLATFGMVLVLLAGAIGIRYGLFAGE